MKSLAFILVLCAGLAQAAPETSVRPIARDTSAGSQNAPVRVRPQMRPVSEQIIATRNAGFATLDIPMSLRPFARSLELEHRVMGKRRALKKGAVCGETALQGEVVGFVPSQTDGCGIKDEIKPFLLKEIYKLNFQHYNLSIWICSVARISLRLPEPLTRVRIPAVPLLLNPYFLKINSYIEIGI